MQDKLMIDIEELEDLEQQLDSQLQEWISDWSYDYNYRLAVSIFTRCFAEQYFFDITFEHNIEQIKDSLKEAKKVLTEKKNQYKRYNNWDTFLEIIQGPEDQSFLYALKWSFGDSNKDISNWENLCDETFAEYVDESIKQLKEVEFACLDFLENRKNEVIKEVFDESK